MKNRKMVIAKVKVVQSVIRMGAIVMAASLAGASARAVTASKSVSMGNSAFGATASASFKDYVTNGTYRSTLVGRADGKVLGASLNLAAGSSSLELLPSSSCHAYGYLKIGGITKATWDTSFTGARTFTTSPFTKTLAGASTRIWFGPLPVTFKAAAKASIYAKGKVNVSVSPSTALPTVQGSMGPVLDVAATLSAGVDIWLAGAEVTGSLTLVGLGVTGITTFAPQINSNPIVTYNVSTDIHSMEGAIKVHAWLAGADWYKTLYEFHGGRNSYLLASGSHQL